MVKKEKRKLSKKSKEAIEHHDFCIAHTIIFIAVILILNILFKQYSVNPSLQFHLLLIFLFPYFLTILFVNYKERRKLIGKQTLKDSNFSIILTFTLVAVVFVFNILFKQYSVDSDLREYIFLIYLMPFFLTIFFYQYKKGRMKITAVRAIKEVVFLVFMFPVFTAIIFILDKLNSQVLVDLYLLQNIAIWISLVLLFAILIFLSVRYWLVTQTEKKSINFKRLLSISVIISIFNLVIFETLIPYNFSSAFLGYVSLILYLFILIIASRLWYSKNSFFD